jgi:hypothetical protein
LRPEANSFANAFTGCWSKKKLPGDGGCFLMLPEDVPCQGTGSGRGRMALISLKMGRLFEKLIPNLKILC